MLENILYYCNLLSRNSLTRVCEMHFKSLLQHGLVICQTRGVEGLFIGINGFFNKDISILRRKKRGIPIGLAPEGHSLKPSKSVVTQVFCGEQIKLPSGTCCHV